MTHTYAELEVSPSTYKEIKRLLEQAGYDHAFVGGVIDMKGIGLVQRIEESKEHYPGWGP